MRADLESDRDFLCNQPDFIVDSGEIRRFNVAEDPLNTAFERRFYILTLRGQIAGAQATRPSSAVPLQVHGITREIPCRDRAGRLEPFLPFCNIPLASISWIIRAVTIRFPSPGR